MSLETHIQALKAIAPKGDTFVNSLCEQFEKRGSLSEKQQVWVGRLLSQYSNPKPEVKGEVLEANKLFDLFAKAKANGLKWPKLTFVLDGQTIQLSQAGQNAKVPGSLNITDGKPYGQNQWFGRVMPDGELKLSNKVEPTAHKKFSRIMKDISADPHTGIESYGQKTGHCCLCGKALTVQKSIDMGMGPVCAKTWNIC